MGACGASSHRQERDCGVLSTIGDLVHVEACEMPRFKVEFRNVSGSGSRTSVRNKAL